jgi:hypothetical protein
MREPLEHRAREAHQARVQAERRVAELEQRRDELHAKCDELSAAADRAQEALRQTLGAAAAGDAPDVPEATARSGHRTAVQEYDEAVLALSGLDERVVAAEQAFEGARRAEAEALVPLCRVVAGIFEDEAIQLVRKLARTMAARHSVAKLASELESQAAGDFREPIPYSSPNAGMLTNNVALGSEGLARVFRDYGIAPNLAPSRTPRAMALETLLQLDLSRPVLLDAKAQAAK